MLITESDNPAATTEKSRQLIREHIAPHFPEFLCYRSTRELEASPAYQSVSADVRTVLGTPELGDFRNGAASAQPRYRFLAWNVERGIELDAQIEAFRSHPYLKTCDVLLLTEVDVGMARSGNRDVARTLARELGMAYAFAPCYLNLTKGSGIEYHAEGENDVALHGNSILSRYPIRRLDLVPLPNGIDKMAGREKRIGRQATLIADIEFPQGELTAVCVHLDANSSQRHRRRQMRIVLDALREVRGPIVLGGDWNTSTYNSSHAFYSILGFWLRVFMGAENVIRNHYLHPENFFERGLFRLLEARGFDYRGANVMGERTNTYDAFDAKARHNLGEWVPWWCFAFMRWALRNHGGRCPLKLDWFATRGLRVENPVVIHDLREGRETPLSDHDAVGIDALAIDA